MRHQSKVTTDLSCKAIRLSILTASVLLSLQTAQAEQASTTKDVEVRELDAVVVTATRREQSLQKVPLAVSVVSGKELDKKQKSTLETIVSEVPTVNFRANSSNKDSSLFVRGVGTVTTSPGVEPSVSTVIDGVVLSRPGQATLDLLDVERVEVLRGPQGTLFGKNASAGVINIVTKNPTKYLSGFVDVYATSDHEQRIKVGASGELIPDKLKANITALVGKFEGNVKNLNNDKDVNGYDNEGFRTKFEYTASDDLVFGLAVDYLHKQANSPNGVVVKNTSASYAEALGPIRVGLENRETVEGTQSRIDDINQGIALTADWTLDNHQLSSITAYRQWKNTQIQDGDQLKEVTQNFADIADRGDVNSKQYSQELRIKPLDVGHFNYVVGLYLSKNKTDEIYQRRSIWYDAGNSDYVTDRGRADYSTDNTNYALFGEGTYSFTDRLRVLAGLRVTRDELSYEHARVSTVDSGVRNAIRSPYASSGSTSETGISGRIGPQFDIAPNINSYLTYSRGYKGPAYNVYFNMQSIDTPVIDPETANSVELGLKTQWLDNRLRVNLAAFHTSYENYQANFRTLDPSGFPITRLVNAGDVYTRGFEIDSNFKYSPDLNFSFALANTIARIDDFKCPANDPSCPNVNGKPLPFSPDWKANAQVDKFISLNNNRRLELSTQYSWQSEVQYSLDQNPKTIQPSYGIWNGSVALNDVSSDWRVALQVRNILDKSYASMLNTNGDRVNRIVPRDDERYFGISVRKDF
ncbi:TonB-dependent receptor (plasmid) [Acinetobacter sp. NCu2D-2]|uniref:TonB-dependent receptor n=1 Tax=Acinetobacter sp. NCu2D-2 TaxID=1608473 RepID=UPI0007CDE1CB|nr:TonB-dependent receptor [Acinetobacter sp. NCu2D-2]ANF83216.1 TonB-dependent receptor [Acinetobacter sp. NCu2D-2]